MLTRRIMISLCLALVSMSYSMDNVPELDITRCFSDKESQQLVGKVFCHPEREIDDSGNRIYRRYPKFLFSYWDNAGDGILPETLEHYCLYVRDKKFKAKIASSVQSQLAAIHERKALREK